MAGSSNTESASCGGADERHLARRHRCGGARDRRRARKSLPDRRKRFPYPSGFRDRLRGVLGGAGPRDEIAAVEAELTRLHAEAVARFRERFPQIAIDLIGFHGHTILHRPEAAPHLADRRRRIARATDRDRCRLRFPQRRCRCRRAGGAARAALSRRARRPSEKAARGAEPRRGRQCDLDRPGDRRAGGRTFSPSTPGRAMR